MDATHKLLQKHSPLHITVHAIAKAAGLSPATFYVYFTDVKDVILALCATTHEDIAPIVKMLEGPWPSKQIVPRVKKFVEAYYAFWDEHRRLLAVRDLEAALADRRFEDERIRTIEPILKALANRICDSRRPDAVTYEDAWAEAVVCCAAMDMLFAYSAQAYRRPETPINVDPVLRAEIEIISRLLSISPARLKIRARRSKR
jgi:AcrR family transcriptional regulator